MFRKQIAAVLTAILVLSMGTACANKTPNTAFPSETNEAQAVEESSEPAAEESAESGEASAADAEGTAAPEDTGTQDSQAIAGATAQDAEAMADEAAQATTADTTETDAATPADAAAPADSTVQGEEAEETAQNAPTAEAAQASQGVPAPTMVKGEPENNADVILPGFTYTYYRTKEVDGRQGIACENGEYWVSGSTSLTHYDKGWKAVATNNDPFKDFEVKVNHIGDIDVYNGEIYVSAENFADGVGSDIQIAVYDAQTLQLSRTYLFNEESGQEECSGIAVDPDTKSIWMCSWVGEESGRYLYRYSLETGEYIGKIHLQAPPQWLQGVAYFNGYLYMTADDGTADLGEPDHIYRWRVDPDSTTAAVTLERTLDDVAMPGEVEGLSFDKIQKKLLVSYNRGAQIVLGMVKGYYDGYDHEIHEVYEYEMERNIRPADYSRADKWVSRPDKETAQAAKADVFMVLPTVNMNRWDPDTEDLTSLKDALRFVKTFNMEKGIFGEDTAVYAPYYRQWTLGVMALQDKAEKEKYTSIARKDVFEAFRWYLENCHTQGKPIVLFGYSQGAGYVKELVAEFGQDERVSGDLVAAYVIGETITQADLDACPWMKMAQGETDTGVIVSFECMGQTAVEQIAAEEAAAEERQFVPTLPPVEALEPGQAQPPVMGQPGQVQQPAAGQPATEQPPQAQLPSQEPASSKALAINPLNWKTDSTPAPKEMNLGYVVTDTYGNVKEETPAFCGAYLDEKTGILVATDIENPEQYAVKGLGILPDGSFHLYDLTFFYNNLKENVAKRIAVFLGEEVAQTVQPEVAPEPAENAGAVNPAESTEVTEPVQPAENAGVAAPAENAGTTAPAENSGAVAPPAENSGAAAPAENAGTAETEAQSVHTIVRR